MMNRNNDLFLQIEKHLLEDEKPSEYLNLLFNEGYRDEFPFSMLTRLKQTDQSKKWHPEGNVWNHTMLVVDEAAGVREKSKNKRAFMWAALLHDIGKPDTTKIRKGKITAYDHDKAGAELAKEFLNQLTDDKSFTDTVSALVRWHMQVLYAVENLPFADIDEMKRQTDYNETALLGLCDRLGRKNADREKEKEEIGIFLKKSKNS